MIMPYACCTKENREKPGSIIEKELDIIASIEIKDLRYMINISNIGQRLSDWIVRKSILK